MRVFEARLSYEETVFEIPTESLDTPQQVVSYMRDIMHSYPCNEVFYVIPLNRKGKPFGRHMVSLGTVNSALVHPRDVFKTAILSSASAIVVVHNHPSGDPAPSSADLQVTRQLRDASRVLEISLMDHVILGDIQADPANRGYYSFREAGLL